MDELVVGGVVIPAADLSWTAVRASGPGGQNVNKVSSKVRLVFDVAACAVLTDAVKARLVRLAKGRLDARGAIVIASQRTRDREKNLADARSKLAALIAEALIEPAPRRPTKPSAAAKRRRLQQKRVQAEKKRARRTGREPRDERD
jgi:ribosome-associated protein